MLIVFIQFLETYFIQFHIKLKLPAISLSRTRIINIFNTAMHELMESQWIMPAVMEDLNNVLIAEYISQQLFCQLKSLYITVKIHLIDVD